MSASVFGVWLSLACLAAPASAREEFETDTIKTSRGDLKITFIGHGTLMFKFGDLVFDLPQLVAKALGQARWRVAGSFKNLTKLVRLRVELLVAALSSAFAVLC